MGFRRVGIALLDAYKKWISPHLPQACIYFPTCSVYTRESMERFGFIRGGLLGFFRLLRCNGWFFRGGEDPVPGKFGVGEMFRPYTIFFRWKKNKE